MQSAIVTVDLHTMNCYQAKIKLDSVLKKADTSVYKIVVVHGFNGGESLKEMVQTYVNHPKVIEIEKSSNKGQSILVLRKTF